ncbi:MAG TPA: alpha/beta hydrolase fold domain-containing protein [Solirubrobacteraceae bacterium]|nr:alpha/beta hydrolase fold domain-containing protein [Solirubrobacteraceae bacterium]
MPLDPDVAAYLDALPGEPAGLDTEAGLAQRRREYDESAPELFGPAPDVATVTDEDAEGVAVRIFRPTADARAALVYLHGGGWVLGGFESHGPLCRALAARSGAAVIAVDYRLAPEHPYPAAVHDAWTATNWAARHFHPIAVAGDSAGGNLAAAVALRARDAGLALALQVLVYPATDHGCSWPSYRENARGPAFHTAEMQWFWEQYLPDPSQAAESDCCPLRASDLSNLAPALVLTAEYDPLRDEGDAYARAMQAAGVPVQLQRYDGLIHGFLRMPAVIGRAAEALSLVADAVREALATA